MQSFQRSATYQHLLYGYANNRQFGIFQGKITEGDSGIFQETENFFYLAGMLENIVSVSSAYGRKSTPMYRAFVPLTEGNRLLAKDILGNRASLSKWRGDFKAYMVKAYPNLE